VAAPVRFSTMRTVQEYPDDGPVFWVTEDCPLHGGKEADDELD